ncbi:ABC transporter ATP-binding protein [Phyllobacterium sp. SB3]|uniref:ABC transporter ATP-binding protein n=1 Tax=Phyllobacterium sp. SB3 TaxID=3156073 RepID=UPI0032AFD07D
MSVELEVRDVSRKFNNVAAVDHVSLTLRRGEIHGLIGPNGSGKTTLLNLISGFYPLNGGDIHLDGAAISDTSVRYRAGMGISRTFQAPKLMLKLSTLDNAMLGGWQHTKAGFLETAFGLPRVLNEERSIRNRALAAISGIGLGGDVDVKAEQLEHSAQRFLEIARAIVSRPKFLLLDEPAGGLSVGEIEKLSQIIAAMRDAGVGILLVEHHTDFVFRICDRVTALHLGKVIASGPPRKVQSDPDLIRVYLGA